MSATERTEVHVRTNPPAADILPSMDECLLMVIKDRVTVILEHKGKKMRFCYDDIMGSIESSAETVGE